MNFSRGFGCLITAITLMAFPSAGHAECPAGPLPGKDIYVGYDDNSYSRFHATSTGDTLITIYDTEAEAYDYQYLAAGGIFTLADWIFAGGYPQLETVSVYSDRVSQYLPLSPEEMFSIDVKDYFIEVGEKGIWRALAWWGRSWSISRLTMRSGAVAQLSIGECSYDAIPFSITYQDMSEGSDLLPHIYHASFLPDLGIEIYQGFTDQTEEAERTVVEATYIGYAAPK